MLERQFMTVPPVAVTTTQFDITQGIAWIQGAATGSNTDCL